MEKNTVLESDTFSQIGVSHIKPHKDILNYFLAQLSPVDFREKAGVDEEAKIARKVYVIITVDELLDIAIANDWGLCTKDGFLYLYNGEFWQPTDPDEFKAFMSEAAVKMGVPELEARYYQFKDELYKQFLSASNLKTPESGNSTLINLRNGTFEISSQIQQLIAPRREDFLKYQLPFAYNEKAQCPAFVKYLDRVLPDADCQKVLAEYIGYIFVKNLKLEKALILYGSGANGKSVFFEVVSALIGSENICNYSLQNLTKYDSYQRAELTNKLLNYASEINGKLEASIFKQLVSGEPVEARQIYGKPFVMRDYGKLMFNCNELPKEVEQTNAFFRRFLIIPFIQTIPEEEQDVKLAEKIIADELSGVFNWVLAGLRRLLNNEAFSASETIQNQISKYRKESDSVAMFLDDEGYKPDLLELVPLKDLYLEYRCYCVENGYRSCSSRTLAERLRALSFETVKRKTGQMVYATKAPL